MKQWIFFFLIVTPLVEAASFAVSPDVITLNDGMGVVTLLNPGKEVLHYEIVGVRDFERGYLFANDREEVIVKPLGDTLIIRFDDGTGFGVTEIEVGVIWEQKWIPQMLTLLGLTLLAVILAAKVIRSTARSA
ncbi:hypothetical protein HY641_00895 [Candidatus Woesearchaeota archaeon]|nr:hypothetical protein [Candidatus Woesearchaeota archaeon]